MVRVFLAHHRTCLALFLAQEDGQVGEDLVGRVAADFNRICHGAGAQERW